MVEQSTVNATIDAYMAAYSAADRAAWLACFADDAWIEDPVGTPRREGLDAIAAFWDETHGLSDSVELRPLGLRVVIGHEATFTMQARPSMGGQTYALDIIDHMTFDEAGRIRTMRAFFDPSTLRPAGD
ncbi:MAG: nuclear transport factor 2 family protein [Acidimicrobiales bacterium]|nr:nuclear transport factor 2 family protein [Acidimicrobiales bacterium]